MRHQDVRVDDIAHIGGNHHAGDSHVAFVAHHDVRDRGEITAEGVHQRGTASAAGTKGRGRCRSPPFGLVRNEVQDAKGAGALVQHAAPERDGVGASLASNQVHEGFDGEDATVRAHAAPEGTGNNALVADVFNQPVADPIGDLHSPIDRIDVDAVPEGRRQPSRHDREAGDAMLPGSDFTVLHPGLQPFVIERPIELLADILLTRPHHLHGPLDTGGDANRGDDAVSLEPAAEGPADQVVVDCHLGGFDAERLGCAGLRKARHLCADPDLASAVMNMHSAVRHFHRRVGEEGQLVGRLEQRAILQPGRRVAFLLGDHTRTLGGLLDVRPELRLVEAGMGAGRPLNRERAQSLHRRPRVVCNHRDEIVEHHHLPYAGDGERTRLVNRADLSANHGRGRQRGELHARQHHVDAVDHFASRLVRRVDAVHRLADQTELRGILQLDRGGRREAGGLVGHLAIPDRPSARCIRDDTVLGA